MWTARLIATFIVAGTLCTFFACSDTAKPLGVGDMVTNDTLGQDVFSPPVPALGDGGGDSGDAYGPSTNACGTCTCDPTTSYCLSAGSNASAAIPDAGGGTPADTGATADTGDNGDAAHFPQFAGFGEPDGAAEAGPPLPACTAVAAGSFGCTPLPTACTATPTCGCLLTALQGQHSTCVLDCTTAKSLDVYCGG
jgi:hypothetical protein